MKNYKLSPSALSLMGECPRCFWLAENGIWKRPSGIFPSLPSGMDLVLKNHFDKFMEKGKLPPELCSNSECKNLKLFDNKKLLAEWRNSRRGLWIEDEEGNILHGGVDNLLVNNLNGKIIVLDYKTRGYPLKEDTHEHYQNQIDIYSFLLKKLGYEIEDFGYLLFYYPKEVLETGEVVFNTALKRMKINTENAEKIWKKALALLKGSCPKESAKEEECLWCRLIEGESGA